MTYADALNFIIEDGIVAATHDYRKPHQKQKLDGSIKGFDDCREKTPEQLKLLLDEASATTISKGMDMASDYWYWRCRQVEIEWVCNVMSCILQANGVKPICQMTARGMIMASKIIGIG